MKTEQRAALVTEIRTDFQIPPYQADEIIGRAIDKCYARLSALKGERFNVNNDEEGRLLLCNAVYYELYHRYEEFEHAWQQNILSWQLGAIEGDDI